MSKQCLDVHQMQHLKELGLELKETMMRWQLANPQGKWVLVPSNMANLKVIGFPAYTLQDVLDALPVEILKEKKRCWLSVDLADKTIEYYNEYAMYMRRSVYFEFYKSSSLIDAAYSMLCWAIEQGYVETDKNE